MPLDRNDELLTVNADRWQRVKQIFDLALSHPLNQRLDFIVEACGGDEQLLSEVKSLLAADERASTFLNTVAVNPDAPAVEQRSGSILQPGVTISGRFQIGRLLGQGGMGKVYEAKDTELGIRVALKTIHAEISSDERSLIRFRREVELTRRITHPNVCRIFDLGRHVPDPQSGNKLLHGFTFLTMELLDGKTLSELLREKKRLDVQEAVPIVEQVAEALAAAHKLGIVHRDIKPSNVMLVPSGHEIRVVVTDFGLARFVATGDTPTVTDPPNSLSGRGRPVGTLAYMAPEQLEGGDVTPATDIYAFGLVIYEMLSGKRPFNEDLPFGGIAHRLKILPPSPRVYVPDIDLLWETAILRCIQIDPTARFQTTRELLDAIKGTKAPPPTDDQKSGRDARLLTFQRVLKSWPVRALSMITIFLIGVALSVAVYRYYSVRKPASIQMGSTVVVTDIKDNVGEERFKGITEMVRGQLSQSSYFHVMSRREVRDVLERMTKPADSHLDPSTAREVALRSGSPRVIFGAVSRIGDNYSLDIEIQQPGSDPSRARAQWENHWSWRGSSSPDSAEKDIPQGLLDAVSNASVWIRHEVGEAANDIARMDVPPQDVTTDNWNALLEFSTAENLDLRHSRPEALTALQNAVVADPHFALAYMRLGDILVSLRRYEEGYRAYTVALSQENQRRLTRKERDRLRGIFALDTGDFPAAEAAFRDYTVYYPSDYLGWFYQAYPMMMMERVEEALTTLKKAEELDPLAYSAPAHMGMFNLILGHFDESQKAIDRLRQIGYSDDADDISGGAEFLQDQYVKAEELYSKLRQSKEAVFRTRSYTLLACLAAELGQYQKSISYLNTGIDSDVAEGDTVDRADKLLARAYLHLKQQDYSGALADSHAALALDRSLQRSATAASILGRAATKAKNPLKQALLIELRSIESGLGKSDFPPISNIVKARVRGEILLAEGKAPLALKEFEIASRLDAPATDRDYLARGLLAAAAKEPDTKVAIRDSERALEAYGHMVFRPGQIWQLPEEYPPGYLSDEVLSYALLAARIGKYDDRTAIELDRYCKRRAQADPGLKDVDEARLLLEKERLR